MKLASRCNKCGWTSGYAANSVHNPRCDGELKEVDLNASDDLEKLAEKIMGPDVRYGCTTCCWLSKDDQPHPNNCPNTMFVPFKNLTRTMQAEFEMPTAVKEEDSIKIHSGVAVEIRTTSSTGGQKGVKPERHSLIPRAPLDLVGRIYAFGAKKYDDHNWRKGYEWSKSYDALQRHLTAWWEREENDPESGLSHLGHACFHIFALIVFSTNPKYRQFDDRYQEPA